jgi:hypothetical protein
MDSFPSLTVYCTLNIPYEQTLDFGVSEIVGELSQTLQVWCQ